MNKLKQRKKIEKKLFLENILINYKLPFFIIRFLLLIKILVKEKSQSNNYSQFIDAINKNVKEEHKKEIINFVKNLDKNNIDISALDFNKDFIKFIFIQKDCNVKIIYENKNQFTCFLFLKNINSKILFSKDIKNVHRLIFYIKSFFKNPENFFKI